VNRAATRALLERRGLRLRRELGQNFLVDDGRADRLAELAGVDADDTVLEIGTGLGTLTRALAVRAARVVTIEIDAGVVAALHEESLLPSGVELVHADALSVDLASLLGAAPREHAKVVANLPYSAATPLLRRLLDLRDYSFTQPHQYEASVKGMSRGRLRSGIINLALGGIFLLVWYLYGPVLFAVVGGASLLLGALIRTELLPITAEQVKAAIGIRTRAAFVESNLKAFDLGWAAADGL